MLIDAASVGSPLRCSFVVSGFVFLMTSTVTSRRCLPRHPGSRWRVLEALTDRVLTTDLLGESEGEYDIVVGFVERLHGFTGDGHRPPPAHLTLAFPFPARGRAAGQPGWSACSSGCSCAVRSRWSNRARERHGEGRLGGERSDEAFGEDTGSRLVCCERQVRMPKARSEEMP